MSAEMMQKIEDVWHRWLDCPAHEELKEDKTFTSGDARQYAKTALCVGYGEGVTEGMKHATAHRDNVAKIKQMLESCEDAGGFCRDVAELLGVEVRAG